MIRSYRADSGKVLGDDMGVPGPHYRHAYSLYRERQGQFVSYSHIFVSSTATFGTIMKHISYNNVQDCSRMLNFFAISYPKLRQISLAYI